VAAQRRDREALQPRVERARLQRSAGRIDARAREVRRELLAERHRAAPRERRLGERANAGAVELLQRQKAAGALSDFGRLGVGTAHQRRGDRRLVGVEAARALAEERLRERVDADDLAAKRHRVEVRLEDFGLLPLALEPRRGHRLANLLGDAATAARPCQAVVDEAGELHRQRRRTARSRVPEVAPRARRGRLPVDSRVLPEAAVLAEDDRGAQRRRDLGQRRPREPAHRGVDANGLDRRAVAVDEGEVGRPVRRLHLGEGRHRMRRGARERADERDRGALHGAISTGAFGASPKLSGAYIASTRVGGNVKRPGLLSRTVYSTTCLPRGSISK
jgi:hypothetical protein